MSIKIAHIFTSSNSFGILADKLKLLEEEKGYDIEIVCSSEGYDEDYFKNYAFPIRFVEMSRKINLIKDVKSLFKLYKLFKDKKYSIVHTHTAKAGILGRIAARLSSVPAVLHTTHGLPFFEGQSFIEYHTYRLFEMIASWFCDAVCSQNREDIEKIKSFASDKKVYYEGNGVDLKRLDKRKSNIGNNDILELKKELGLNNNNIMLVAARFEPVKNHELLLKGLKYLKFNYGSQFTCLLAGQGYLKNNIEDMINQYNLNDCVKIIGFQSDIFKYIELSDLVVLTSKKEGIPRIIMEGMAFSKAVVATDVLGTRELVRDGRNGYLVSLDPKKLAKALYVLINDDKKRNHFGVEGRKIIEKEFTERIVISRIDKIYKELLK